MKTSSKIPQWVFRWIAKLVDISGLVVVVVLCAVSITSHPKMEWLGQDDSHVIIELFLLTRYLAYFTTRLNCFIMKLRGETIEMENMRKEMFPMMFGALLISVYELISNDIAFGLAIFWAVSGFARFLNKHWETPPKTLLF